MATEKTLNTRIQLKYDTLTEWEKVKDTFIPRKGEVCITEVPAEQTAINGEAARPQYLIKVGDGKTKWGALNWVSAKAADVYAWAKAANKPTYSAADVGADAKGTAQNLINALDVTDTAEAGKYVSAVSETDGKIKVTRADLPSLKKATESALGGIKTGYTTNANDKNYSVEVDNDGNAYVNVPWTDTDTNTTYTGSAGITVGADNVIKHTNTITEGAVKEGGNARTLAFGGKFKVPSINYDAQGHITSTGTTELTLPSAPATPGNGALTIKVGSKGDISGTGSFTANQSGAGTITLPVYTKTEVDAKVAGATQYLGTVASQEALDALTPGKGDFVRVSTAFGAYHPSDMLICEASDAESTQATWSVIHGEIDSNDWVANSKTAAGYVAAGGSNANKVWKTDANGNPGWRDDADTNTKVTSADNHYEPAEDTSKQLSVDASDATTAATWNSTNLVTGVNLKRDAKGHVVGVTVDSIKMPANPNTDTHHQAKNIVGASATAKTNAAVTGNNANGVYLNLIENDTVRSAHKITGNVGAKVTSDTNGNITVGIDDAVTFVFDCGSATENIA